MDFKRLITYAFLNNELIESNVAKTDEGFPLINPIRSPESKYPLINISFIGGGDLRNADDRPYIERFVIEIDLYGNVEYKVVEEIKSVMNDLGFLLLHFSDFKDLYTGIVHNVFHFRQSLTKEIFDQMMEREHALYLKNHGESSNDLPSGKYYDVEKQENYIIE